jgi:hypothetical protein
MTCGFISISNESLKNDVSLQLLISGETMHRRLFITLLRISAIIAVLISCAKISAPTGGPRDRTPPAVVKSTPPDQTKNFKGNKIETEFDEYIALDNINDKFMVSPPMKKKPRVMTRGKSVVVEFDEKLKDSTTYTFYFQDAIKDLNEGNILPNFQFVLSTGPVIDSLSVTGNLYIADNLEVPEKTQVIMYRNLQDSAVEKMLPEYITRVDPTGYFRIDNVRPGIYNLYGLKDNDNSKNYNLPEEEIAFMDSTISVTPEKNFIPPPPVQPDTVKIKKQSVKNGTAVRDTAKKVVPPPLKGRYPLFLFTSPKRAHYLASSHRDQKYQLLYILSLPPDTMKFDFSIPDKDKNSYFTEFSRNRDSLMVWLTDSSLYSLDKIETILNIPFTDSAGITGYKLDSVTMRFNFPKPSRSARTANVKVKKTKFTFETNIRSGNLKPGAAISFNSKTPFAEPDTSRIRLFEIVQPSRTKVRVPFQFVKDSLNSTRFYMETKVDVGKKYLFIADSGSISNIYKESNDSIGINFTVKDPESYCKLTLNVRNYIGDRVIQLLDKTDKLISQTVMKTDGKVTFSLLDAGVYRVRVIYDKNGDKKWTTGDFKIKRQPEPVSYYPGEIELKTGWNLEQDWDISNMNFKDYKLLEVKKK